MSLSILPTLREAWRLTFHYPPIKSAQTDYDAYWKDKRPRGLGELNSFQRFRLEWAAKRIAAHAEVLDYGCGDGAILSELRRRLQITAHAADLSPLALEFLKQQGFHTHLIDPRQPDQIASLPEVDHVILFEVLEHLSDPEELLLKMLKKVRRSVFFSIPNSGYFPYRLRLLCGSSFMQWRVHPGEHLRFWTVPDLQWWLAQLGLQGKARLDFYEGLPLLNRLWPGLFAMGIIGEISR